jgi:hypothetical protein
MKLIDAFNNFCKKQTEKKNEKLLEKYAKIKEENITAVGFYGLLGLTVFPPALIPALYYAGKEKRLEKKLQKRGLLPAPQ